MIETRRISKLLKTCRWIWHNSPITCAMQNKQTLLLSHIETTSGMVLSQDTRHGSHNSICYATLRALDRIAWPTSAMLYVSKFARWHSSPETSHGTSREYQSSRKESLKRERCTEQILVTCSDPICKYKYVLESVYLRHCTVQHIDDRHLRQQWRHTDTYTCSCLVTW